MSLKNRQPPAFRGVPLEVGYDTRISILKTYHILRAIPERLRGVITTRRTNPRSPLPLPFFFLNCELFYGVYSCTSFILNK